MSLIRTSIFLIALFWPAHSFQELFCHDDDFFYCGLDGGNKCIPVEWVCDYVQDCPNGRDEINCNYFRYCSSGDFLCHDGHCIDGSKKCDNHQDCADNSDEDLCGAQPKHMNDSATHPMAAAHGALPHVLLSSMHDDDQLPAQPITVPTPCQPDQYFCGVDGANMCIPAGWRCDNVRDCPNGKDEDSCEYPVHCKEGEFLCHSGECISADHKCDHFADCHDYTDEIWCKTDGEPIKFTHPPHLSTTTQKPAPASPIRPKASSKNRPKTTKNSSKQASSQEPTFQKQPRAAMDAATASCDRVDEFLCKKENKCIDGKARCDGKQDCIGGEDEIGCCEYHGTKPCASGSGCYFHRCDGFTECEDGSDEVGCDNDQGFRFTPNGSGRKSSDGSCEANRQYKETMKDFVRSTMTFMHKMSTMPPCQSSGGDPDADRSVLIEGIPEPYSSNPPSARRQQDFEALVKILDSMNSEADPIAFYRVGKVTSDGPRALRVIFAAREHAAEVLLKTNQLQAKNIMIKRVN